ncbi:hypothetical protein SAMN05216548_108174 [Faunimonas pinastri]|uniref:DUF7699 domain-containing protein n=1 Tax=Faunimonas pinastri TaxID=1855383 RepID=A0A1H9JMA1_9HYPH|nr:hypothetical protein [Faunimonas pinastri]SEQ87725.1 hypothetical protein SAMN05216548_108174 [Faunimonas pinastri]
MQSSDYCGDEEYSIRCTGDACRGDEVRFYRAIFSGSYRRASFEGFERVTGKIISDSYGSAKQQHTFTILLGDGTKTRIKGRNLYSNGVYRKPWADQNARQEALDEKHERGDSARAYRDWRRAFEGEHRHHNHF